MTMLRSPRTDGLLCCPRRGCDELLAGVRALTFHLHIHAVGAGAYACLRCGGAFESARDLARHACARRRARGALFFRVQSCRFPPLTTKVLQSAYVAPSAHGRAYRPPAKTWENNRRSSKSKYNKYSNHGTTNTTTITVITSHLLPLPTRLFLLPCTTKHGYSPHERTD
jgi:hypothetical protein